MSRSDPEFRSYYGRPVLKPPVWKQPDVPLYLFLGGAAGASAVLAEGAAVTGRPQLERWTRRIAAGAAVSGVAALVHDLGRPARFLNMLRVFKPTSPLSVGSWILAPFSGLAFASALSAETGVARPLGRAAGVGAAVLGPPLATYTGALIADTAVPAWHESYRELPYLFVGSGAAGAGGMAMMLTPVAEAAPARRLAVVGSVADVTAASLIERRLGVLAEPYREGRPGRLMRLGRVLHLAGAAGAVIGGRSRILSGLAGAMMTAGSVATRFGVFQAGLASAKDPKYTVVPQRHRIDAAEAASLSR